MIIIHLQPAVSMLWRQTATLRWSLLRLPSRTARSHSYRRCHRRYVRHKFFSRCPCFQVGFPSAQFLPWFLLFRCLIVFLLSFVIFIRASMPLPSKLLVISFTAMDVLVPPFLFLVWFRSVFASNMSSCKYLLWVFSFRYEADFHSSIGRILMFLKIFLLVQIYPFTSAHALRFMPQIITDTTNKIISPAFQLQPWVRKLRMSMSLEGPWTRTPCHQRLSWPHLQYDCAQTVSIFCIVDSVIMYWGYTDRIYRHI